MQVLAECKQKAEFNELLQRYEEKSVCEGRTLELFLTYPMHQVQKLRLPLFTFKRDPTVNAFTDWPRRLHFLQNGATLCENGWVKVIFGFQILCGIIEKWQIIKCFVYLWSHVRPTILSREEQKILRLVWVHFCILHFKIDII